MFINPKQCQNRRCRLLAQLEPMRHGVAAMHVGAFITGFIQAHGAGDDKAAYSQKAIEAFEFRVGGSLRG
jgi:hypothetical protein